MTVFRTAILRIFFCYSRGSERVKKRSKFFEDKFDFFGAISSDLSRNTESTVAEL